MNIKYGDFLEICKAFYKLPKHDFLVFDFLADCDIYYGNYTKIGKEIDIDASNVRKACKRLVSLGVIATDGKEFFILDNWYNNLLKNADKLPGFKAETYKRKKGKK